MSGDPGDFHVTVRPAAAPTTEPADDPESVARWNRLAAQHELDAIYKLREASIEQATSMAKWLLASLLAINAAGALAVLNAVGQLDAPALSGAAFVCGMLLPLLSATAIQHQTYASLPALQELAGYYLTVVDDGERVESREKTLHEKARRASGPRYIAPGLGWLSAVCFVVGAYLMSADLMDERVEQEAGRVEAQR